MAHTRPRIAVIYHFFPHYRAPIVKALAKSDHFDFEFWGAHEALDGIPSYTGGDGVKVNKIGIRTANGRYRLSGFWKPLFSRRIKALIVLGNPNIPETWLIALIGRITGKAVLFWAHGWLRPEAPLKAFARNMYFRLANVVLVYGDRARMLAKSSGFPEQRVRSIYNSLDWDRSLDLYNRLGLLPHDELRHSVTPWPYIPLLICTARLTSVCSFDVLLRAMAHLASRGQPVSLNLVGDGPERASLEALAKSLDVRVQFMGAIYDEEILARLIYAADVTVSPGKVGLTAMHSLTYGTPVITHGNLDEQMPEVEAITSDVTGAFFERGNVENLADTLARWLSTPQHRENVREVCRETIASRYTPGKQRELIEQALSQVLGIA